MDIETAEAVDTLRTDIRRVEKTLTGKIEHVETNLTSKMESVETSLIAKMDEHKSQTGVRLESMHDDIRLLAEHLASLGVEVRSLRR